ncbi:MAG: hypothetical protein IKN84_04280 [Bacteroidales bacterium]|jgi:hypothetical protein|nr:hypothetical protein [Bacteroidales bacterium]
MKKTIAYLLFLLAALSASAQTRQMMLHKGDYRMDGGLIVTNDSLLQHLRSNRYDAIWLETPHNGVKLLKPHYWNDTNDEPADCDGSFYAKRDSIVSFRDSNHISIYQRWTTDFLFRNAEEKVETNVRLTSFGMYYPRGEYDTATTHPYPATAIAFRYADEEYYIPVSDSMDWDHSEITIRDSVHLTISIQRYRLGPLGESPYAEVVAMKRIHVPGEEDTLGRFVCYNGDTICFTSREANWEVYTYSTNAHPNLFNGRDNIGELHILSLQENLCKRMRGVFFKYVQFHDRGNRWWTTKYRRTQPKDPNVQGAWPPNPCTIYLQEEKF